MSKPTKITKGDVLDDLGFSLSEASALKVKATIVEAILAEIDRRGLTQRQLADILEEYQPNVSNLLNGRIGIRARIPGLGARYRVGYKRFACSQRHVSCRRVA